MPSKKKIPKRAVKRRAVKRKPVAKKKAVRKKPSTRKRTIIKKPAVKENVIGVVTHYFPHVRAAVIKLKAPLSIGEVIKIKGHTTDFTQSVVSMQIDRVPINQAKKGDEIGLLVNSRVRQHDTVSKV
jgi:hypothetical protein